MKTWLLAFVVLAATSCSLIEDIDPFPDENHSGSNPIRLTTGRYYFPDKSFNQVKYIYNNRNRLIRKDWYNAKKEVDFYEDFIYVQGRLVKIKRNISKGEFAEVRFTYNDSLTHTIEYWMEDTNATLKKLHSTEYEYTGAQITKSTTTFYNGSPSYYSLYTFANGNLTSVKAYQAGTHQLLEENHYEYDAKLNPYYKLSNQYLGSLQASSINNVVHYKIISYKHIPSYPEMYFEYTYNDKGYPTEKYILGNGKRYIDESFSYAN